MRIPEQKNIINFRSLGGHSYPGGKTAEGKAFRCGIPRRPSEEDIGILKELGIKHIIDLRGEQEAEEHPLFLKDGGFFDCRHLSTLEANPAFNDVNLPIWEMYRISLTDYRENYGRIFRLMLSFDEPFLFHCFLGKDRTGIIAALLLGAAGVSEEEIISDYCLSGPTIAPFIKHEIETESGLIWEQDPSRLRTPEINMVETLRMLNSDFGGISGYIESTGLTSAEAAALGNILK